jgi:outer membrane receptor protein involved in Fe transport
MQRSLKMGVSTLSLTAALSLFGASAFAQTTVAAPDGAASVDEVVVTGSRIVTAGFSAPTPVTVVSTEQLQRTAPGAIPEGLNQLPQFAGSRSNATSGAGANSPSTGNYLNLRNLGANRTLILLDGQRLPPTTYEGITDANIIPQALVQRVEVVTGGASAAYGSDAVSGVINFVLDTKYNGVKGLVQWGETRYHDAPTFKANIAAGGSILDGRIHLLASYDHYQQKGLPNNQARPRGNENWLRTGAGTAANPYKEQSDVRFANASYGTLIAASNTGNPLRNYTFIPGGLAVPFNLGTPTGSAGFSVGGDGVVAIGKTLTGTQDTDQLFLRADFEVTPGIEGFAQLSYSKSFTSNITVGSGTQVGDFRIFTDNAFIADSTRATLRAAGVDSFIGSRLQADQPFKLGRFYNDATIFVAGLKGELFDKYRWDVGYSHGDTGLEAFHEGNFDTQRYYAGLDAVRNAQGQIVCRITITNPGVLDACVPFNIFGNGSPSKEAYNYIAQTSTYQVAQTMDIVTGNISGEVFQLPAGPVSLAVGVEYRRQDLDQTSNTDPSKSIDLTGIRTNTSPFILRYNSTNVGSTSAKQNVKEAYGEVAVPLLKDVAFARELSLNGAFRYTDYSTSGSVKTWKVGGSWSPIDAVRIRATRSRDIRAPTLNELFAAPNSGSIAFLDIHTNTNARLTNTTTGNPQLTPELADTLTAGVVFRPSFAPRLQMSVDYYTIKIKDAIGNIAVNTIVEECEASNGASELCSFFQRPLPFSNRTPANFPSLRTSYPINLASVEVSGLDFEVSYRADINWGLFSDSSTLDMRVVGGHLFDYLSKAEEKALVQQTNNSGNNTKDRVNVAFNWRDGPFSLSTQTRFFGTRKKTQNPTVVYSPEVDTDIPSLSYTDATATYRFERFGGNLETYLTITNLFDKDPPLIPDTTQPGQIYPANTALYDIFGRTYTAGLRFSF